MCRLVIGTVVEEKEEVDKTKGVIRIRRKDRQQNDQKDKKKKTKRQTMIYKTLHIALKIE